VPVRGEAMTIPEAPMPKGSPFDAAKLTARISEAPPNAQSYATLGSAALDASQPELPQPKSRKAVFLVVALLGVAALAATGVSFTMFRPKPLTAAAGGAPATTTVAVSAAATPVTASAAPPDPPTATTTSSTAAGIPTYAASSLPKVTPKVPMWTPPPVRWTPPPATAAPQATTPPKTKPKVDDGF
jgi:hypothetical protein